MPRLIQELKELKRKEVPIMVRKWQQEIQQEEERKKGKHPKPKTRKKSLPAFDKGYFFFFFFFSTALCRTLQLSRKSFVCRNLNRLNYALLK